MSNNSAIILNIHIGEDHYQVTLHPGEVDRDDPFFTSLDTSMDEGRRMGPQFVENPNQLQRGQIISDRLLAALESGNEAMMFGMLGYLITRFPDLRSLHIDTNGEPLQTVLEDGAGNALTND